MVIGVVQCGWDDIVENIVKNLENCGVKNIVKISRIVALRIE